MKNAHGFTLVEVLIALAVFSLLSAASVGILGLANQAQERAEQVTDGLSELERFRTVLRTDFLQVAPRRFRDPLATEQVGPLIAGLPAQAAIQTVNDDEGVLMAFVRNGWSNPAYQQPRASLQQVIYVTDGTRFIRRVRPFIDATGQTPSRDEVLIDGVSEIEIFFYNRNNWWPDVNSGTSLSEFPAVRVNLQHPVLGPLTMDFLLGGPS